MKIKLIITLLSKFKRDKEIEDYLGDRVLTYSTNYKGKSLSECMNERIKEVIEG